MAMQEKRRIKVRQNFQFYHEYLRVFWAGYGYNGGINKLHSPNGYEAVIAALCEAGEILISRKGLKTDEDKEQFRRQKRADFDAIKNQRKRFIGDKMTQCLACGGTPEVRHHIIWLKNGGYNTKRNICFLCRDCHAEIHDWLKQ